MAKQNKNYVIQSTRWTEKMEEPVYWCPDGIGYTNEIDLAWKLSKKKALEIEKELRPTVTVFDASHLLE